ncbi:putative mitochondrial chaperone BCS1-B [Cyphellophora attinorum]|uniref:Putative mitochondrial chaperone BCS1-B n=1 Tax=Cyphellophora attinorum TaxID=1664694 RepID=A0A0N0NMR4_9EURO|nr:putative mitochondrial chaperone BCS1-B [Phialophora attinorum]KPI40761.1 putative mitochondrial chaperone BCS1-B [Phialophora attinorum]
MDLAPAPDTTPSLGGDAFDPFSFFSNSVGLPAFIAALLYPQVKEISKRFPRLWKLLSAAVVVQLTYRYTQAKLKSLVAYLVKLCASSIKIQYGDELMGCFQRWLDKQKPSMTHRELITARSLQSKHSWRPWDTQEDLTTTPEGVDATNILLRRNYNVRMFRHKGRFFWLTQTLNVENTPETGAVTRKSLMIWTLGNSVSPIAAILDEAVKEHSNDGEKAATTLFTPFPNHQNYAWDDNSTGIWRKHAVKPCRPLDTVYLAGHQRELIEHDVARFLHADTAARYRSRGIPHRRGYLFYGPPGNGKSSLAMALAGHFGLNVYSLSLRDAQMSDTFLSQLFNALPSSKVLVLLEDIDSAGLKREEEFEDDDSSIYDLPANNYLNTGLLPDGTFPRRHRIPPPRITNVTLSGVLNALDGIAAPEGHIVVMTTNAPDSLDKALTRPGRIDTKIEFKNASPKQLYDIFHRMYRDEHATLDDASGPLVAPGQGTSVNSTASTTSTNKAMLATSTGMHEELATVTPAGTDEKSTILEDGSSNSSTSLFNETSNEKSFPASAKISGAGDDSTDSSPTPSTHGTEDENDGSAKATGLEAASTPLPPSGASAAPKLSFHYTPLEPQVLDKLATQFSQRIPAQEHSLASVQNYLLGKVDQPHLAVREAAAWAAEERKEKEEYEKRKAEKKLKRELEHEKRMKALKGNMDAGSGGGDVSNHVLAAEAQQSLQQQELIREQALAQAAFAEEVILD